MTKPLVPTEDLLDAIVEDIRTGQWIDDLVEDVMACIVDRGWRIVRTGHDGVRHGSKPHVAIFDEWAP